MVVDDLIDDDHVGAIMWFICSEMTPQAARSIGATLCIVTNSLVRDRRGSNSAHRHRYSTLTGNKYRNQGLIILNFVFPPLQAAVGGWVFLFFVVPTLICATVLYFEMPETKNREVAAPFCVVADRAQVDDILRNWYDYTPRGWKLRKQRAKYAETVRRQNKPSQDVDYNRKSSFDSFE